MFQAPSPLLTVLLRRPRHWLLPVSIVAAISCAVGDPSPNTGGIAVARDSIRSAVLRGDAAAVAAHFTQTARIQPPDTKEVSSRDSIRALFSAVFQQARITEYDIRPDTLLPSGSAAVEMGDYTEHVVPTRGEPTTLHGRYAFLWQRETDGNWRAARLLYNHAPGAP